MFVFGSAITEPNTYERYGKPGIQLASEPDSVVLAYESGLVVPRQQAAA